MKPYIPLVSYSYAEISDSWAKKEERACETRTRHWNIVWWKDENGYHTADFGVITESMPDFCGGMMVYSPFVNRYDERGAWNNHFCGPGSVPAAEKVETTWDAFDPAVHAVDLAKYTGKEEWTWQEVSQYLHECLAAQVAGDLIYHGKRGFMGADRCGGRMSRLIETMEGMGEFLVTPTHRWRLERVGRDALTNRYKPSPNGLCGTYSFAANWWIDRGNEWYNTNSGNTVWWLQGGLTPGRGPATVRHTDEVFCSDCDWGYNRQEHDECPECGYDGYYNDDYDDEDPDDVRLPERDWPIHEALRVMQGNYAARARRHQWRNG